MEGFARRHDLGSQARKIELSHCTSTIDPSSLCRQVDFEKLLKDVQTPANSNPRSLIIVKGW